MDLYIIVYLLSNIFLAHIINKFMYLFYEKCRVNKYIEFSVYSAYFILITFVFLHFGKPIVTIGFNIFSIFAFTSMYDYIDLRKNVLVTFIVYLVLCLVELTVVAIISFNNYNGKIYDEYVNMLGLIIDSIIYIVISFLIYLKKFSFKKIDVIFSNKYFLFFNIIPILSVILIIITFWISKSIFYILIINLSILFLNIFIFKYCDLILNNLYEKVFDKFLKDKINIYKKEIQNFEGKIEFKRYINSNNYVVDGILNSKINDLDNEIKLEFDISITENLNINLNDLLVVIGNLMDNAISGVKSTLKNKEKYIDVKIKYVKGTIILNIKNSFNGKILYKHKRLFNSKNRFNSYGLGLLSVKEIVEKYQGVLDIKFNKNNFETYVFIYDIEI